MGQMVAAQSALLSNLSNLGADQLEVSIRTRVTRPSEGWNLAHTFAISGVASAAVALMQVLA